MHLTVSLLIPLAMQMPHTSVHHFKKTCITYVLEIVLDARKKEREKKQALIASFPKALALLQHHMHIGCLQNITEVMTVERSFIDNIGNMEVSFSTYKMMK